MRQIITSRLRVHRVNWLRTKRYTNELEDWGTYQSLRRVWYLFGVPIFFWEIDREDVPKWAVIQNACLGSTDWRSSFPKEAFDK